MEDELTDLIIEDMKQLNKLFKTCSATIVKTTYETEIEVTIYEI